jgi:DNA-binding NarL/FixJ family response regulator
MLLDVLPNLQVVGETSDHDEAMILAAKLHPDVVVISMRVNGSTGPNTTREILKKFPKIRVIFLTLFDDAEYVKAAMDAGAHAYVLKQEPAAEVKIAIIKVLQGEIYLSPALRSQP